MWATTLSKADPGPTLLKERQMSKPATRGLRLGERGGMREVKGETSNPDWRMVKWGRLPGGIDT